MSDFSEDEKEVGRQAFGDSFSIYNHLAYSIISASKGKKWKIHDNEKFDNIIKAKRLSLSQKIYWNDILSRASFCAHIATLRSYRWLAGAIKAKEQNNSLVYSSCVRGLIESFGDSNMALNEFINLMLVNSPLIKKAYQGKSTKVILSSKVEDAFLHFEFGGNVKNKASLVETGLPKEHLARKSQDYILIISNTFGKEVVEFYKILCGFVHPSVQTVHFYTTIEEKGAFHIYTGYGEEDYIITILEDNFSKILNNILQSFNPAIITLAILDDIGFDRAPPAIRKADLQDIEAWKKYSTYDKYNLWLGPTSSEG